MERPHDLLVVEFWNTARHDIVRITFAAFSQKTCVTVEVLLIALLAKRPHMKCSKSIFGTIVPEDITASRLLFRRIKNGVCDEEAEEEKVGGTFIPRLELHHHLRVVMIPQPPFSRGHLTPST